MRSKGFTLFEMSLVLVIIGLITGSVLVGQNLIRAAQIRNLIKEADAFKAAVQTFQTKYGALPGDIANATTYFGAKADCTDRTEFTQTCNGDGNNQLSSESHPASTTSTGNELFLFWQHLANAGLISGKFNGVEGTLGSLAVVPDINSPSTKIPGGAWIAYNQDASSQSSPIHAFKLNYGNYLLVAVPNAGGGALTSPGFATTAIVTPAEAYSIDVKIDEGKPGQGNFIVRYWSVENSVAHTSTSCTNATSDSDFAADYNLTNTQVSCVPQFDNAF